MAINPKTPGIHHINLRSSDLQVSRKFYSDVLGFPIALENDELFAFPVGSVFIVFKKAANNTQFNPFTIGTDHIAIACESEEELNRIAKELSEAKVENTGVKLDSTLNKLYVAFKDPDRIQWEFYMI
ncbi:MAG TPA: VOC family protein [Parafilimonas sp.]|nr:VOC family protein [Parafilimonas sp.]